jgi:23S rRNA pseudouridine1911/1915/1917 synthase
MARLANRAEDYIASALESIEATIPETLAGFRLDQALAALYPQFSRTRIKHWIEDRKVWLDGAPASAKQKVWGMERVRVEPQPAPGIYFEIAQPIPLRVIHEDPHLLVLDKPAGLVAHPGSGNWQGTLLNALLHHAPQLAELPRAGIVHRLDKNTSGVLVVAKTQAARASLIEQLSERAVKREYLALVHGALEREGVVEASIGRHPTTRTKMAVVARGKPARTHYAPRQRFDGCTLVALRLETGRTHQIRVHMHSIDHPVVGDPVYGTKPRTRSEAVRAALAAFPRQALHAERLALMHPMTGGPLSWNSPLPEDMANLLDFLREQR